MKVRDKTCIFCFFPIINKYRMAKRSLLSERPSRARVYIYIHTHTHTHTHTHIHTHIYLVISMVRTFQYSPLP